MNTISPDGMSIISGLPSITKSVSKVRGREDGYVFRYSFDGGLHVFKYEAIVDCPGLIYDLAGWIDNVVLDSKECKAYEKMFKLHHNEDAAEIIAGDLIELLNQLKSNPKTELGEYHIVY